MLIFTLFKKYIPFFFTIFIIFGLFFPGTFAATPKVTTFETQSYEAKISSNEYVEIGKKLLLDTSSSNLPIGKNSTFQWSMSNGNKDVGNEVIAIFDQPGTYTVTVTITIDGKKFTATKNIFAYKKIITFFYNGDDEVFEKNINEAKKISEENAYLLSVVKRPVTKNLFSADDDYDAIMKDKELLLNSDLIIAGPDATKFLSLLTHITPHLSQDESQKFKSIPVVISTKDNLLFMSLISDKLKKVIPSNTFNIIQTDVFSSINSFVRNPKLQEFIEKIPKSDRMTIQNNETSSFPYLILSLSIAEGITSGVPHEAIIFILFIPFLMLIISFMKQVIGLETIGVFHTVVLTLCFLILGLAKGSLILLLVIILGVLTRLLVRKWSILYMSKLGLQLSLTALATLFILIIGAKLGIFFGLDPYAGEKTLLSLLPMLIIAMESDKLSLIAVKQRDTKDDILKLLSTFCIVCVGYLIIRFQPFEMFLFAIPEIVFLAMIAEYILGRYKGLRAVEFIRFRELLRHDLDE